MIIRDPVLDDRFTSTAVIGRILSVKISRLMLKLSVAFQGDKPLKEYGPLARLVEEVGFDTVSLYEDLMYQPAWQPLQIIAAHTRRVQLGPAVINPYLRHPAIIAGEIALLNEAAGGRAYLGLGKGAFLESFNVAQPRPISAVRDAIEIVRRILSGDRTPYEGRVFQAGKDAYLRWRPSHRRMPILVGTWGPRMAAMAGALADEVKVGGCWNPDFVPLMRSYIDKGALEAGRDPADIGLAVGAVTVVSENGRQAEVLARRAVVIYLPVVIGLDPTLKVGEDELVAVSLALAQGDLERAAGSLSQATLRKLACFGAPEEIVEQVTSLAQAGVTRVEFGAPHGPNEAEAIRLLGERVLPAFR